MLSAISSKYLPDKSVISLSTNVQDHEFLLSKNSELKQQLENGKDEAAVFICENFTCSLPIRSLTDLNNRLQDMPTVNMPQPMLDNNTD
uniref:Uncharacterized protein n=1 Tax=Panagrolaimus superbus TaxID=310955 RepID=A0A914YHJ2_9BILA